MLWDIQKEFNKRHNFNDEDIGLLKERWSEITFHNIPLAWVFPLDEMLCKLRYNNPIYEIRQEFGQLIILSHQLKYKNHKVIIKKTEQAIYNIDKDLLKGKTNGLEN